MFHISVHWLVTGEKLFFSFRNEEFKEQILKADEHLEKKYIDMTIEVMERVLKENRITVPV